MKMRSPARELAAIAIVGALLLGAQAAAHVYFPLGETPNVWLGGVLTPGMSEADARSVLNKEYELLRGGGEDYYLRAKAGEESWWMKRGLSSETIAGAVWFHNGKLTRLTHHLYRSDVGHGDAAEFAEAAHVATALATNLTPDAPCQVTSESRKWSTVEVMETDISCGRRTVRMVMSRAPGTRDAQLQVSEEIK